MQEKVLMMKNEYTSFSVWDDMERNVRGGKGNDTGTRGVRSTSGPTCVTELEGDSWQFSNSEGVWVMDASITARCAEGVV